MRYRSARVVVLLIAATGVLWADLSAVKAEPNLERRSERAIEHANEEVTAARGFYDAGKMKEFAEAVQEVGDSVQLALDSLEEHGRDARRHPKYFKRAELGVRDLLRRIEQLREDTSVEDRDKVEAMQKRVQSIEDELLQRLMEKKK